MSETTDAVGALAMSYIDRTLRSGKDVTIPSLGIVIKGDATVMYRWDDLTPEEQSRYLDREKLLALVDRYGAAQWRRGNAGKDPQEFAEWQQEQAADRRAAFNGGEI